MKEIREEWIQWMEQEHLKEVLATNCFTRAQFNELLEPIDEEGYTFSVQYTAENLENYQTYINQFATALRQKGIDKFGNQFIGFRSLSKTIKVIEN